MAPLFSILIPTRNRGHLLDYALRSALNQTFDDYEIIVSDNDSQDDTRSVVDRLRNSKVQYVKTPKMLPMTESWEFALSHARGEWITVLCDDSALLASSLEAIAGAVRNASTQVIAWPNAEYYHPSWPRPEDINHLKFWPFADATTSINSKAALKKLYNTLSIGLNLPSIHKGICHRKLLDGIKAQGKSMFLTFSPDYSSSAVLLFFSENYLYIDTPFTVMGYAKESIGESAAKDRGKAIQDFVKEFSGDTFTHTPLKLHTLKNYIAETLLRTREAFGQTIDIHWDTYYYNLHNDLLVLQKNGVNVEADRKALLEYLTNLKHPLAGYLENNSITDPPGTPSLSIRGEDENFHDILEAASYLEQYGKIVSKQKRLVGHES